VLIDARFAELQSITAEHAEKAKGFKYFSVGQDMLAPRKRFLAVGWGRIIGKDFIFDVGKKEFHPLPGKALPQNLPDMQELTTTYDHTYGIGWWRVRQGDQL
jgi:hypothetical protein